MDLTVEAVSKYVVSYLRENGVVEKTLKKGLLSSLFLEYLSSAAGKRHFESVCEKVVCRWLKGEVGEVLKRRVEGLSVYFPMPGSIPTGVGVGGRVDVGGMPSISSGVAGGSGVYVPEDVVPEDLGAAMLMDKVLEGQEARDERSVGGVVSVGGVEESPFVRALEGGGGDFGNLPF